MGCLLPKKVPTDTGQHSCFPHLSVPLAPEPGGSWIVSLTSPFFFGGGLQQHCVGKGNMAD